MAKQAQQKLRIATRESPLALWQANYVKGRLQESHADLHVELHPMTTQGDQLLDRKLATSGGKGLFLKELEVSLLDGETDIAVHSMKDVPVELPEGLKIASLCSRADPRDAFVSNHYDELAALPTGAVIGTSSLRRISQLQYAFPDLSFKQLRGNVNTRLAKLDDQQYDAIILAAAGLQRLELSDRIRQFISPEICLPAAGQGIVGIECRTDDKVTQALISSLHNEQSAIVLTAERALNADLDGGCQAPIAAFAELTEQGVRLRAMVGEVERKNCLFAESYSTIIDVSSAHNLGRMVAAGLLQQGAKKILQTAY